MRTTSTATGRTVRPGPPSTTPNPHRVRPGSTPNTRTVTSPRAVGEHQFETLEVRDDPRVADTRTVTNRHPQSTQRHQTHYSGSVHLIDSSGGMGSGGMTVAA
ncbi:hypothetical protein GCM10009634_20710 [Saccharothrix xinjiangensis]